MLLLVMELLVILLYFSFRVISPMPVKPVWRILAFACATLIFCKFPVLWLLGGGKFSSPSIPAWFTNIYDILFSAFIFSVILLLLCDVIRLSLLGLRICHVLPPQTFWLGWQRSFWFYLIVAIISLILAAVAFYNALYAPPEIRPLCLKGPETRNFGRLVVLSDLHFCERTPMARVEEIVRRTNELDADAIVILGDVVDGDVGTLGKTVEALRELKAKNGVYLVSGNHEYYSGYHAWMAFYRKLGIRILDNAHAEIADGVHLFGICDPQGERMHEGVIPRYEKIGEAAKSLPESTYKILLSHRPYLKGHEDFQQLFQLQLSGHTHGGMMPILKSIVGCYQKGRVSGLYRLGKTDIYVSNGTGIWYGFPVRLFTPAEITCITFPHDGER